MTRFGSRFDVHVREHKLEWIDILDRPSLREGIRDTESFMAPPAYQRAKSGTNDNRVHKSRDTPFHLWAPGKATLSIQSIHRPLVLVGRSICHTSHFLMGTITPIVKNSNGDIN